MIRKLFLDSPSLCLEGLGTKEVQDLKKDKYDFVILSLFFDYCYLSLVDHFKVIFVFKSYAYSLIVYNNYYHSRFLLLTCLLLD